MLSKRWTQESILAGLRAAGETTGRAWTIAAWQESKRRPSSTTVTAVFGSWTRAWQAAGYPPLQRQWTREEVLNQLRAVGTKHGTWLTMEAWRAGRYSPNQICILRYFGNWRASWRAAGFDLPEWNKSLTPRGTWTAARVLDALRQIATPEGTVPGPGGWCEQNLRPNIHTIQQWCGSYQQAVKAAGLTIETPTQRRRKERQAILGEALHRLTQILGHTPSPHEWNAWPDRPAPSRIAWRALQLPQPRVLDWPHRLQAMDLNSLTEPERTWAVAITNGATLSAVGRAVGLSLDRIRWRLGKAIRRAEEGVRPRTTLHRDAAVIAADLLSNVRDTDQPLREVLQAIATCPTVADVGAVAGWYSEKTKHFMAALIQNPTQWPSAPSNRRGPRPGGRGTKAQRATRRPVASAVPGVGTEPAPNATLASGHAALDNRPVSQIGLSVRVVNGLRLAQIQTVGQLRQCSDDDLLHIHHFGVGCLREIHRVLAALVPETVDAASETAAAAIEPMLSPVGASWENGGMI